MIEQRCWYESRMEQTGIPFISIKNNGESTLVFNPNLYGEALYRSALYFQGNANITLELLKKICSECNLCTPKLEREGDSGFRIYRRNYEYTKKDVPLAEFNFFKPTNQPKSIKVALIDDTPMNSTCIVLSKGMGYEVMSVLVDANVRAGLVETDALTNKIIEWGPDWVISDKGLGYVDGIRVIQRCKESGIRTIMLTGELQTAETRKVADYFLTKPLSLDTLNQIIG